MWKLLLMAIVAVLLLSAKRFPTMKTWNPAELPDDTVIYVPNFGETTVGELRGEPDVGITESDMLGQPSECGVTL